MEQVKLAFNYTKDDYIRAERQYLFASKTITKPSVVILALYFPGSIIWLFFSSFNVWSVIAVVIAIIAITLGCTLYFCIPRYKINLTTKYHEEYHLTFSNDGIKFKTSSIDSELKWSVYSEMWESNDFYFLIQAPRMYTLIPKWVFENHVSKQTFEEIVLSSLKSSKRVI